MSTAIKHDEQIDGSKDNLVIKGDKYVFMRFENKGVRDKIPTIEIANGPMVFNPLLNKWPNLSLFPII